MVLISIATEMVYLATAVIRNPCYDYQGNRFPNLSEQRLIRFSSNIYSSDDNYIAYTQEFSWAEGFRK